MPSKWQLLQALRNKWSQGSQNWLAKCGQRDGSKTMKVCDRGVDCHPHFSSKLKKKSAFVAMSDTEGWETEPQNFTLSLTSLRVKSERKNKGHGGTKGRPAIPYCFTVLCGEYLNSFCKSCHLKILNFPFSRFKFNPPVFTVCLLGCLVCCCLFVCLFWSPDSSLFWAHYVAQAGLQTSNSSLWTSWMLGIEKSSHIRKQENHNLNDIHGLFVANLPISKMMRWIDSSPVALRFRTDTLMTPKAFLRA